MALTPVDKSRINEGLAGVFDGKPTALMFNEDTDAFLTMCLDEADDSNGGRYFMVQVVGLGDITSNATMLQAGGRAIYDELKIDAVTKHIRGQITQDSLLAAKSRDQANGGFDLTLETVEMHISVAKQQLGLDLGGKGWGSLAGIYARTTGALGTITVGMPDGTSATAVAELARRFFVGQRLYSADLEDTGNMKGSLGADRRSSDAIAIITAINYQTGVLSCDTVPASFAVGDYIGQQGNRYYDAANGRLLPIGMEGWLPPEVATDTIGGKSRSGRPDLQPDRFDATGKSIKDAFFEADTFHFVLRKPREGMAILCTPEALRILNVKQEALKTIEITRKEKGSAGGTITIGVGAFEVAGQGNKLIPVIGTNYMRPKTALLGPLRSPKYGFKMKHGGKSPVEMMKGDNGEYLRYVQGGVTDSAGDVVPGFEFNGFIRCAVTLKFPNAYVVLTAVEA